MSDFDLDLQTAEGELDELDTGGRVVLGVLDGTTDDEEWIQHVSAGDVVVLNVEGDLNELASGFAREIRDMGGELMHFRDFLVISPPGREIDTDRLD
ncbi:hypothetical protein HWV07_01825 [Natronomonas salina]|uniref:DUF5779 family protein n=1 Tax=Natronomonas salina TaxID=1710540 RepID=UPI0015B4DF29|nr:DUF5779 family protein [Natronomonas salina]QLD87842.1 hypothetical protein HWV07_01825 [Natronomonas salina]